jgi:hypothetical protein
LWVKESIRLRGIRNRGIRSICSICNIRGRSLLGGRSRRCVVFGILLKVLTYKRVFAKAIINREPLNRDNLLLVKAVTNKEPLNGDNLLIYL